jgi:formate hydrogenlyase transcriptional activator
MFDITKIDAFVQSSPHPAWLATSNGECVYANPALERLTGLNSDQINQADWRSLLVEEDRVGATASWQRSLATRTPYRTRVRIRGFDDVPAMVEVIAFGHKTGDGPELWLFAGLHVHGLTQQYPQLEAQLQATLNVIPAYTWYANPSGGLTFLNERLSDYLGLPKDHPLRLGVDIGAAWDSHIPLLHPDDHQETRKVWSTCLRTGSAGEMAFRVRNAEDNFRWFLSRAEPLRASDGTLLYWIGVNLDIEERKRAEFYLAEGQRLAHMGSWACSSAGFEYWSPELFQIHGLDPRSNAPTVEEYLALVHPEDRGFVQQEIQKMLEHHRGFDFTKRIVRPDGAIRRVRSVGVAIGYLANFQRFVGTGMDVTEQEALARELRRSKKHLTNAQTLSHTGNVGMEVSTKRIFWSEESARIYGYPPGTEPTADLILQRVHPDDVNLLKDVLKRAAQGGENFDFEHRLLMPDGSIKYIHNLSQSTRDEAGNEEVLGAIVDITEHKFAEEAIRRSAAYLAEAQRLSHTGSFGWSVSSGEIFWSEETFQIFAYDGGTKPTVDLVLQRVHPEDRVLVQQTIEHASEDAKDFDFEHRLLMPDGSIKQLRVVAHALSDQSGSTEFVGAVMDITVSKQTEDRIRLIINTVPGLLWSARPDGWVDFINQRWLDYTGMTLQQALGWGWAPAYHPDEIDQVQIKWRAAVAEGKPLEIETRLRRFDGEYRWFLERVFPLFDRTGHILGWYGSDIDIHERKQAEDKIREQEMELRQILDLAPQHVHVLAADARLIYTNEVGLKYHGPTLEEWRHRPIDQWQIDELPFAVFHPDDRERMMSELQSKFLSGSAHEAEARLVRCDGKYRWFLFRFSPLRDAQGRVMRWYVAGTDIEDRKQAENRLRQENVALREEVDKASMCNEIVGTSPALKAVLSLISKVAPSDSTVLITGETGTGKELVARAIHGRSDRASRAFVSVNCAAVPRDLIASELFGHEKGAFTGATQQRLGRFELANGGTIFLDEVGELPAETQLALLRVLQEHEFERVGGTRRIRADVRVIAATNRDLQAAIRAGAFRSDLFYRLHVFPIELPSLRERRPDIPLLVEYFIDRYARKAGKNIKRVSKKTLELLESYPWPGNIRELQNVIERSVILCESEIFSIDQSWLPQQQNLATEAKQQSELPRRLLTQEKKMIEEALKESRGRVFGPAGAAAKLGIPRSTLESKIKSLKINKNRFKTHPET